MTPQEIFDAVSSHLLKQNERSTRPSGGCAYRSEDGLKCAVGCLIPDEKYSYTMEGTRVLTRAVFSTLPFEVALDESGYWAKDDRITLLDELQLIHDQHDVSYWPTRLRDLAERWKLKFNAQ